MRLRRIVLAFAVSQLGTLALAQGNFSILYNFCSAHYCSDGASPNAGVIQDPSGNLYGTTWDGGYDYGVAYKLDTAGNETVLYSFCSQRACVDGENPLSPLTRDEAGDLYGTTQYGGTGVCDGYGCGTVFEIDTAGNETVLYSFTGGPDGCFPYQGLARDRFGNLYGTTVECGSSGYGTIFKVDSAGNFTLLHSFAGKPSDGAYPGDFGHLVMGKSGDLYGVTKGGGSYDHGTLYKLSKSGTLTLLHDFAGGKKDGCVPRGSVVLDEAGSLYGTTWGCGSHFGSHFSGTIWKVSQNGKETILHSFAGYPSDGCRPAAGVARDAKGNMYGVTYYCGADRMGTLYKLSAKGKLTLLHSFAGSDGANPVGDVLLTGNGTLFAPPLTAATPTTSGRCGRTYPKQTIAVPLYARRRASLMLKNRVITH